MPIPRKVFDKGKTRLPVWKFLEKHKSKAFTTAELGERLGFTGGRSFLEDFTGIVVLFDELRRLIKTGTIQARFCHDEIYYAWRNAGKP